MGLSPTAFAIYGLLRKDKTLTAAEKTDTAYSTKPDQSKADLASLIEGNVTDQITVVAWVSRENVQKEMRKRLKRILRDSKMADEQVDRMAEQLVDLLKRRNGRELRASMGHLWHQHAACGTFSKSCLTLNELLSIQPLWEASLVFAEYA